MLVFLFSTSPLNDFRFMSALLFYLKHFFYHPLVFIYGFLKSLFLKKQMMNEPIDFVVTWVDGNDKDWQKEKDKYQEKNDFNHLNNGSERYRDWEQFKYWFRAVEKYAPWVNKIYLVTYGHIPEWLNLDMEKLVIVNHRDYIDEKYLPTFSSIPIELNIHKIKGLSEHFVYFNDDTILNSFVSPEDFFQNGFPLVCSIGSPIIPLPTNTAFWHQLFTVTGYMNRYNWEEIIEKNPAKWFNHKYGFKLKYSWETYQHNFLLGIEFTHMAQAFRKSTMEKVWSIFSNELDEACTHKFRKPQDANHQVFTIQEIVDGTYIPMADTYYGKPFLNIPKTINEIIKEITHGHSKIICVNDTKDVTENEFEYLKNSINKAFEEKFPKKSQFEK